MQILNLEVGLRRTMKAAFVSNGLEDAAADAKATLQMETARDVFLATVREGRDPMVAVKAGMTAVSQWAKALP